MTTDGTRYAVVVADDFGASLSVNSAVAAAHDNGILTAASIMAGGAAFDEALDTARSRRGLSVGLHVTLCDGKAVLPHAAIPDLVDHSGRFEASPARAWMRYRRPGIVEQLDREIEAQFDRLERANVRPTHVDGHHHLHMHPAVFGLVCRHAALRGVRWIRIPREPLSLLFRFPSPRRAAMPFIEWTVFTVLGGMREKEARRYGLSALNPAFGTAMTGHCDERLLTYIFKSMRGSAEVFAHPDAETEAGQRELEALTSPALRRALDKSGVVPAGYGELAASTEVPEVEEENA
jgi:hopanoid biosynthesis associated protein HpnK